MYPRTTVALSGPDNVGKSTQLRILGRRCWPDVAMGGALHEHDQRWREIRSAGMATWWFDTASLSDLASVLASSYLARHAALPADGLRLVDRGIPMLEAMVAATISAREGTDDDAAYTTAIELLSPFRVALDATERDETGVLLLHEQDPADNARLSLAREIRPGPVYQRYQTHLARQIARLDEAGRFAHTIVVGSRSIMQVQYELRQRLCTDGIPLPELALEGTSVVGLGGMSESGKSTAGGWFARRHGFVRLKIGYLMQQAAITHGLGDPYLQDETTQAELLVDALDRYASAHYFHDGISIESLHRHHATDALKVLLGSDLTIAYVETSQRVRAERGQAGAADIAARDAVKHQRGADRVRDIADVVIDNGGTVLDLRHAVDRVAYALRWPPARPIVRSVEQLGMPAPIESLMISMIGDLVNSTAEIDLIAVTGSGGRGKYQHGWSDVDVLVIAGPEATTALARAAGAMRYGLGAVKLGLTLIRLDECRAGALTPRLVHNLRQLATGELAAQWCRPDLRLPCPPQGDDATASCVDAAMAATEIRRQLIGPTFDIRALYKLVALLAKVILRVGGQDPADDEAALRVFVDKHLPQRDPARINAARTDPDHCRALAEAVLGEWLTSVSTQATSR